jgi:hypothetical protein
VTRHLGGAARVVRGARRDVAEDDLLGDAAAEQDVFTLWPIKTVTPVLSGLCSR